MPQEDLRLKPKYYGLRDRVFVQAQQLWIILIAYVMTQNKLLVKQEEWWQPPFSPDKEQWEGQTITYGDLAILMGHAEKRAAISLIRPLKIIGHFCEINDIPPLDCIVVGKGSGVPGGDLWSKEELVGLQKSVMDYPDWFLIRPPTTGTLRNVWESMSNK